MNKRLLITVLLFCCLAVQSYAVGITRLYLPGYNPIINNQVDIYKIDNGLNFNKEKPYLIPDFGTTSETTLDFEEQKVIISTYVGDEMLYPDVIMSWDTYIQGIQYYQFHKMLISQLLTTPDQESAQTGGLIKDITIDLPNIAIPKSIRRILGNKAGRLNLDGSQKISLSGTSTKKKIVTSTLANQGSRFELKMQQDTNLNLSGTIGEKIQVNLKYNSNQDETLFDPNNVNIKYTGDEDEVVQSIEAGNISLALSGSRYISYSTSSQGLFGVTSKFKVGALDLAVIASKEEGQKNTQTYIGKSQADSTIIDSRSYAIRTFYFIDRPELLFQIYTDSTAADFAGKPIEWLNNAIKTNGDGTWKKNNVGLFPKNGTMKVYIDDGIGNNNQTAAPGDTIYTQSGPYVPYYDEQIEGTDVKTYYNDGIVEILKPVDRLFTIAVQYTNMDEELVPSNSDATDKKHVKLLRVKNQVYNPADPNNTWVYQMRNVYNLGIADIKKEGFKLEVFSRDTNLLRLYSLPDEYKVDPKYRVFNNFFNLNTDDIPEVNGDDAPVDLGAGRVIFPFLEPFRALGEDRIYEVEYENVISDDYSHFISVQGKIGRDVISLGQTGVLKGSVKVKVDGVTAKENVDYIVDYDMGQITFLTSGGKNPDAKIEIDYEYRSGFAVAQKSLVGVRADWNISEKNKLGATIMYRSEKVEEKRPKIGSENMQLFLADIDGSTSWTPGFVTKMIDAIPLIKTKAESKFTLSGEIAMTIPNITGDSKHKDEAYIDDMEGVLDSYPLGINYGSWVLGSKPYQSNLKKGTMNWFNPDGITMGKVYDPNTLNDQELTETIQVLALKLKPNSITQPGMSSKSYGGIMKYVGNELDFSKKKFIELMVKVDSTSTGSVAPNITLHVDLGDINENFYDGPGGTTEYDTEDKDNDGIPDNDYGLDGIANGQPGDDPNDNFNRDNIDGGRPYLNGTEGNNSYNGGLPDTEDLDGNLALNTLDRYISYSTNLPVYNQIDHPYVDAYISKTGYMLLRIPLDDQNAYEIVNSSPGIQPALSKISYIRIWLESDKPTKLFIASASIVGNKWENFYIRNLDNSILTNAELATNDESFESGIVDNQKNSDHYVSPPNTTTKEAGSNKADLEQSLTLNVKNLQPGHQILLRQRLFDYYDLRSYGKLRFWVYPELGKGIQNSTTENVDVVFRIGADSLNYYQVRQAVNVTQYNATSDSLMARSNWIPLEYELQDFSSVKDTLVIGEEYNNNGKFFSYKGNPTLSNIKEFTIGIAKQETAIHPYTGITYFDDIRAAEPYEDEGWAGRLSFNSVFADFATLDIDVEQKSLNFNPNIQRGRTQNTGFSKLNSLRMNNKYFLDKFFPDSWGLKIPLSLERNYSQTISRYRANSDVLRSKIADPLDKEREKSENLTYDATLGISQSTPSKNKIIAYTLSKMSLSGKVSRLLANAPLTRDTTFSWQGTYNYNVNLPETAFDFNLFKNYRFHYFPTGFTNSFNIVSTKPASYNWEVRDTLRGWYPKYMSYSTKYINTDNGLTWSLTPDINSNYRLVTKRDLMQKNYYKSYNVGKETEFSQDVGLNYSPEYFPEIFNLTNSVASKYSENQRKYTENIEGSSVDLYQKDGSSTRTIRMNFTLLNSSLLTNLVSNIVSNQSSKPKQDKNNKPPKKTDDLNNKENDQIDLDKANQEKLKEQTNIDKDEYLKNIDEKDNNKEDNKEENKPEKNLIEDTPKSGTEIIDKPVDDIKDKDTTPGKSFNFTPVTAIGWLSKVKNVTATYQNGFIQSFSRRYRRPNFAFQLGLPHQVPDDFLDSRSLEDTYTLASGIGFSRNLDTTVNYSYSKSKRFASASNQTVAITFPDITVTLSDFDSILKLDKFIENTRINSNYQFTLRQNGDINWKSPKQETKTTSFSPLISVTTNLAKTVQTTLAYNDSYSENITDMTQYKNIRTTKSQGVTGNFQYSFKSSKGIEIPFTKRKINIKNELTSSLAISYNKDYNTVSGISGKPQTEVNTSRVTFTPTATYQFDQNIRGSFSSGYELTTDKKKDDFTRIFRLGISVEITL